MEKVPVRFKRVAAAFDEASRVIRLCESSGSEHYSPEDDQNSAADHDLSDLVNSFIERELEENYKLVENEKENDRHHEDYSDDRSSDSDAKDTLQNFLLNQDEDDDADARQKIRRETARACGIIGERSSPGFKRRLMSRLRDRGYDAGLCKSRWEKFGRHPAGDYEYVDVNFRGNRYVVEVFLAGQFEIARPTRGYVELLDVFPQVYIGKPEELKQVVRLMCNGIRESMKGMGMHVAPWRRNGYMQAKWFGHYKRTTNEVSTRTRKGSKSDDQAAKRALGFEPLPVRAVNHQCRDDFASKVGLRSVSHLTAALSGNGIDR